MGHGMVTPRRPQLVAVLRQRVLRALQIRALVPGDRLSSTRELAREFAVDPRVVAAAYRELAAEGLVELRGRSGVFVPARATAPPARARPSTAWLADLFVAGIARGVPAPNLAGVLRRSLGPAPFPVAVIATTADQTMGMCRELERHVGLDSTGVLAEALPRASASASAAELRAAVPRAVQRARLLVTTEAHARSVAALASRLGKASVAVTLRTDLFESEWALLRAPAVYVVVADPRFGALVADYLRSVGAEVRVHVLVAGQDDVARIPESAPTYVTQAARERLGRLRLPAGTLPPARVLGDDCLALILRAVLDGVRAAAAPRR